MSLRLKYCSLVSKRLAGAFFAVLTLTVQSFSLVNVPTVLAVTTVDHIVINEIMAYPANGAREWVELYNPTSAEVDMSGWRIKDGTSNFTGVFPSGTIIAAHSWLVREASNSSSSLRNDSAQLILASGASGAVVDDVTYSGIARDRSYARSYDASSEFTAQATSTKGVSNGAAPTPASVPNAVLSSVIPSVATTNEPVVFTSSISDITDAEGVMVRVRTTVTAGSPENIVFEYQESQDPDHPYYPLDHEAGSDDYYFGSSAGFPLVNATSTLRITFKQAGSYAAASQIINVADDSAVGLPITHTIEVSDPVQDPQLTDTAAPMVLSAVLEKIGGDRVTGASINPDGKLSFTITTDEEILDWKSQAFLMRTTADGGAITLPRTHFIKVADKTYRAFLDITESPLAGAYTENMRIRFKLYDVLANATPWTYLRLNLAGDYDGAADIYRFVIDNVASRPDKNESQIDSGDTDGATNDSSSETPSTVSNSEGESSGQIFTAPIPLLDTFGPLALIGNETQSMPTQDSSGSDDSDAEKPAVLGTRTKEGTLLSDTATLDAEDKNGTFLGLTWLWWMAVLASLTIVWLVLAAIIRRVRGTEI